MTIKHATLAKIPKRLRRFPDFEPRADMQNWLYLYRHSFPTALTIYLGSPETTVAGCEIPLSPSLRVRQDLRIPDLMVSYNADPKLLTEQKGYAIDTQGKPPDFVLEIASPTTGMNDYTVKRSDYERYGVQEYWRFDPSGGDYHDAALAGDRLVDGRYVPITIEWLDGSRCRGFSEFAETLPLLGARRTCAGSTRQQGTTCKPTKRIPNAQTGKPRALSAPKPNCAACALN